MSTPPSAASDRADRRTAEFAREVAESLRRRPRQLPTHYLYDDLGSSLFEAICHLPWYLIARVEQRLLEAHASAVLARTGPLATVVELGPGSGDKLLTLLAVRSAPALDVHLIDVSAEAIAQATKTLSTLPGLRVRSHQATYESGLGGLRLADTEGPALVVFLGSNIGNFDPEGAARLLRAIRAAQRPGDALLVGTDLIKPESELLLAYDDPLGVTAAFNRNLLLRMNRELGADFDLAGFAHRAAWNGQASRMEMHLVSVRRQQVRIAAADMDVTFDSGEAIWTESSYKYHAADIDRMFARAGFTVTDQWESEGFALTLGRA